MTRQLQVLETGSDQGNRPRSRGCRDHGEPRELWGYLLFADGSHVPVEVKRRLAGADDRTRAAHGHVRGRPRLPVGRPPRHRARPRHPGACSGRASTPGPAARHPHRRPAPRRACHLGDGGNPFGWDLRTAEQDRDRERSLSKWLSANDPDVPWERIADTLLDRTLGAPRDTAEDAPGPVLRSVPRPGGVCPTLGRTTPEVGTHMPPLP
jgi:hypothetical protein